jgi:hypothetical protein
MGKMFMWGQPLSAVRRAQLELFGKHHRCLYPARQSLSVYKS